VDFYKVIDSTSLSEARRKLSVIAREVRSIDRQRKNRVILIPVCYERFDPDLERDRVIPACRLYRGEAVVETIGFKIDFWLAVV